MLETNMEKRQRHHHQHHRIEHKHHNNTQPQQQRQQQQQQQHQHQHQHHHHHHHHHQQQQQQQQQRSLISLWKKPQFPCIQFKSGVGGLPWLCTEVRSWSILCWYFHVFSTQFKRCWKGSMNTRMSKAQGMECPMFMTYHGRTKPTKVPVGFGLGFSYSAILFPKNWDSIVNPRFFSAYLFGSLGSCHIALNPKETGWRCTMTPRKNVRH